LDIAIILNINGWYNASDNMSCLLNIAETFVDDLVNDRERERERERERDGVTLSHMNALSSVSSANA
jgi:hypothetical protein